MLLFVYYSDNNIIYLCMTKELQNLVAQVDDNSSDYIDNNLDSVDGYLNKIHLKLYRKLEKEADSILEKSIEMAKSGDSQMIKLLMDKMIANQKSVVVNVSDEAFLNRKLLKMADFMHAAGEETIIDSTVDND